MNIEILQTEEVLVEPGCLFIWCPFLLGMQTKNFLCLWTWLTYPQYKVWRGWEQTSAVSGNRKKDWRSPLQVVQWEIQLWSAFQSSRALKFDSRGALGGGLQGCIGPSPAPCYSANSEVDDGAWFPQSFGVLERGILPFKCCTFYLSFLQTRHMHTNTYTAAESLPSKTKISMFM